MAYMGMSGIANLYEPMSHGAYGTPCNKFCAGGFFDPDPAYTRLFDLYSREKLCRVFLVATCFSRW